MKDQEIHIRKGWPNKGDFDPSTKIEKVKTDYYRKSFNKKAIEDALREAEEDDKDLEWY